MIKGHPHICLFKPEIPQNTGSIARLAAGACCRLHLIKPFGFSDDDKNLKRAGLDYWPYLDLEIHDDLEDLLNIEGEKIAFLSKFADKSYTQLPADTKILIFGQETSGLPKYIHAKYFNKFYKIPIFHQKVRSLNLSNAVSIVVYHMLSKKETPVC